MGSSSIAPLARIELDRLTECRTASEISAWAQRNAARARRRERTIVELLAGVIAARHMDGSMFYRLELDSTAAPASILVGRLVTAIVNLDDANLAALTNAWAELPIDERTTVLTELAHTALAGAEN